MLLTKKQLQTELIRQFTGREVFSRDELFRFFRQYEPDLKEGTFGWRIYELKQKHLIKVVKKGFYTLEQKQPFNPLPDGLIQQLAHFLQHSFTDYSYNIWTTAWLNEFIELQATSFIYIVEVNKEYMQNVFFTLKDKGGFPSLFLKPNEGIIETYISEVREAIVIEPMITRAPVVKVQNIYLPTLEKILVDLYCDNKLFFAYQGYQLVKIYEACLDKYLINYSRLFNYAKRRTREEALKAFLVENDTLREKIKEFIE